VSAVPAFELVSVKVSVEVPVGAIELGEKNLVMEGGAITVIEALDVLPVPPFVDVTVMLLFFAPAVEPTTSTENVHELLAASVAPAKLMDEEPAVAVIAPAPQVPVNPFGVATIKPVGNVSVKATPVSTVLVFGLLIVKLKVVVPFNGTVAAPKDLVIDGGPTTVTVFEPVLFVSLYSSAFPLGSTVAVFARLPAAVGVTENVILNELFTGIVTPNAPAVQLKAVPLIEQLIVPIGAMPPIVTVTAPCG